MKWRSILICWGVACLAATCAYLLQSRGREVVSTTRLFEVGNPAAESVDRLEIYLADSRRLEFAKENGAWSQVFPFKCGADSLSIRALLDGVLALEASRVVPISEDGKNGEPAAVLGLAQGAPYIIMGGPGGVTRLDLGRRAPAGRAWVRVGGRGAAANVPAMLHEMLLAEDPAEWRDPALFPAAGVDADQFKATAADARTGKVIEVDITRVGQSWRLSKPVKARADAEGVHALLSAVARARSSVFVSDNPASLMSYGLDKPVATVSLSRTVRRQLPSGEVESQPVTEEVLIGQQVVAGLPDRYAMRVGVPCVLEIDGATVASLLPDVAPLVDPIACGVSPADVGAVLVEPKAEGARPFTLRRKDTRWELDIDAAQSPAAPLPAEATPAAQSPAATGRVDQLLANLCAARAGEVALQAMPQDLVVAIITLIGFEGKELARVIVGHELSGGGKWALDDGDGALRVFPAGFSIQLDPADYRP